MIMKDVLTLTILTNSPAGEWPLYRAATWPIVPNALSIEGKLRAGGSTIRTDLSLRSLLERNG